MTRILKLSLVCGFWLTGLALFGQQPGVAINGDGSTADPSAILDISSINKGLLVPRIALVSTTTAEPVTDPQTSLLVFNTATSNDVVPGFYYWQGSGWVQVGSGRSTGSSTTNVSLTQDGADVILTDSDGNTVSIPLAEINMAETITSLGLSANDNNTPDDTSDDFQALIYTDENGTISILNLSEAIASEETTTSISLTRDSATETFIDFNDEDGATTRLSLISSDASNSLVAGTDGGLYFDASTLAVPETNTSLSMNASGELVYTNEDADNANVALISTDANNDISAGTDGRLYLDAITTETNTTLALSAGELVYTNEDADNANIALISTDANNDISAGTDGRLYMDQTNTTLSLTAGELVYTNEDADNANVALISTDANNDISAGTDGRLYLDD